MKIYQKTAAALSLPHFRFVRTPSLVCERTVRPSSRRCLVGHRDGTRTGVELADSSALLRQRLSV
jgi:hypothetical protein